MGTARTGIHRGAIAGAVILASVGTAANAAQQTATWLGGDGSWVDPTKWSGGVVPNNSGSDTYRVVIDGAANDSSSVAFESTFSAFLLATIDELDVRAGDRLRVGDVESWHQTTRRLTIADRIQIDGTMLISGGGEVVLATGQALEGTGVVSLFGYSKLRAVGGPTVIGPNITVQPQVSGGSSFAYFENGSPVGDPAQPLVNRGRIIIDNGQLGLSASHLSNLGTIEVRNNGVLILDADFTRTDLGNFTESGSYLVVAPTRTFNNVGDSVDLDSSTWTLQGTIKGGTLAGSARGLLVPYVSAGTLDGVTLDNAKITLTGSLNVVNGLSGTGTIVYGNPEAIEGSGNLDIPVIPPGVKIDGSPADFYLGEPYAFRGVIRLAENQGTIRVARNPHFEMQGRTTLEGLTILNRGTLELSPDGILGVQSLSGSPRLTFADGGKLVIDGGGLMNFAPNGGTLDLSSALDQLVVHAKPDDSAYDMVKIVDGQQTIGVFNVVTRGITVTYLNGDIFISGRPVPEPIAIAGASLFMVSIRRRR